MLAQQKNDFSPSSVFQKQIAQICQLCLIFQTSISEKRSNLFTNHCLTPSIIWSTTFSTKRQKATKQHLYTFMHKHGSVVSIQQCQKIMQRYSTYKDDTINAIDLWSMFRPKDLEMVDQITKTRQIKGRVIAGMEIDFRAKEMIVQILEKTMQYEEYADRMRSNISKFHDQLKFFSLAKVQAKQLHLFLINYFPSIKIKECEIILNHIIGLYPNKEKQFYSFFLQKQMKCSKTNPLENISSINQKQKVTVNLELYSNSNKMWKYGKMYGKHSKPLYLT